MLPTYNSSALPVFNYTGVIVLGALVLLTLWWFVSVRHWFKGPHAQGSAAELSAIEQSVGETIHVDVEGAAGGQ